MDRINKKNLTKANAFTLSEVLITVLVIGIVAAIIIPIIVNRNMKKELETQFIKSYANLASVYKKMYYENGGDLNLSNSADIETFFSYFNKIVGPTTRSNIYKTEKILVFDKKLNLVPFYKSTVSGGTSYVLQDGTMIGLYSSDGGAPGSGKIIVDTNGVKKPNRLGYDVFTYVILKGKIATMGAITPTNDGLNVCAPVSKGGTSNAYNGSGCTKWAFLNKCPWDTKLKYWDCIP